MSRAVSAVRGSVPFSGWAHEFRDAPKKKKELFLPVPFWAAHLIWCWTYPIRDKKNRRELSWQGPIFSPCALARMCLHRLSRCCRREHAVSLLSPDENGEGSLAAGGSGKSCWEWRQAAFISQPYVSQASFGSVSFLTMLVFPLSGMSLSLGIFILSSTSQLTHLLKPLN